MFRLRIRNWRFGDAVEDLAAKALRTIPGDGKAASAHMSSATVGSVFMVGSVQTSVRAITRDTKVRSKLHHGHQSADCERTCPRPIRTTLAPSAGVVQNLAHAAMSVRRFSNRSPRPGYFFA